jgi:hypothetical protein
MNVDRTPTYSLFHKLSLVSEKERWENNIVRRRPDVSRPFPQFAPANRSKSRDLRAGHIM